VGVSELSSDIQKICKRDAFARIISGIRLISENRLENRVKKQKIGSARNINII
jgi:hypothetical protein